MDLSFVDAREIPLVSVKAKYVHGEKPDPRERLVLVFQLPQVPVFAGRHTLQALDKKKKIWSSDYIVEFGPGEKIEFGEFNVDVALAGREHKKAT